MALTDAPTITLAGQQIASQWTRHDVAGLAGVSCTWGRSELYEEPTPAQLTVRVIDPLGELAATSVTGERITITRGDGLVMFRGHVNDHTARYIEISDPQTGRPVNVWLVEISAACMLAALAQAILPGPGTNATRAQEIGPHYWETEAPAVRLQNVLTQGADAFVNSIEWFDAYGAGDYYPLVRYRKFADQHSALQLILACYHAHPLAHAYYDPHAQAIKIGKPAQAGAIALQWENALLVLDAIGGHELPAGQTIVPDGELTATTTLDKAISVVQVTVPNLGPSTGYEIVDATTERQTALFDPTALGRRPLAIRNDVFYNQPGTAAAWQELLADDVRAMVDQINGLLELPEIALDTALFDYNPDILDAVLRTYTMPQPFVFPGSVFAPLQAAGAAFQVIGGTWGWDGTDWFARCRVAPALLTNSTGLTVDQLVTIDAPTLADFDPEISLADLGTATIGVTA